MKKLILLLAAVALATSVWAQDTPKKPSFAGFVSNGFWDNWEITLGGGAGTALSNGTNQGSFGDRINFEANFGLTKWFHPVTGMRLQLQGGRFANFDDVLGKAKWPYLFVHADFMLNFSNWAGGYREDRAYYAVPFAGFGYMASNFTDKSHENNGSGTHQSFAFTLGWLNKFRISPSFDFNIELKGLIAPSRVSPVAMDGSYLFGFSATAGFTYRFNKRGWQRGVAGYTVADIQAFQDAVAASMAAAAAMEVENAQLAQQLAASQAELAATADAAAAASAVADPAGEDPPRAGGREDQERPAGHGLPDRGPCRPADGNQGRKQARRRAPCQAGIRLPRIEGRQPQAAELRGQGQLARSVQEGSGRQPCRDHPVIGSEAAGFPRSRKEKGAGLSCTFFLC